MSGVDKRWLLLGDIFPPTLNKVDDPSALKINETPDAYGLDPNGLLKAGSCPVLSAARIDKTSVIGADTYHYWFDRLWRWTGTKLYYGAPDYLTVFYRQAIGEMDFLEDAQDIVTVIPFSGVTKAVAVFKSTGAYIVSGMDFQKSDLIQEARISTATHVTELGGIIYFSNTSGLFALTPDGVVVEISAKVRGLTPFLSSVLTCDYNQRYVIGTTNQWCYDTLYKKLFDYSATGFRYTTPTLRMKARGYEGNPFVVDALAIEYKFLSTADTTFKYQVNVGDRGWGDELSQPVANNENRNAEDLCRVLIQLDAPRNGRSFAVRLTALDAHIEVSRIWASTDASKMEGYTE